MDLPQTRVEIRRTHAREQWLLRAVVITEPTAHSRVSTRARAVARDSSARCLRTQQRQHRRYTATYPIATAATRSHAAPHTISRHIYRWTQSYHLRAMLNSDFQSTRASNFRFRCGRIVCVRTTLATLTNLSLEQNSIQEYKRQWAHPASTGDTVPR